MAKVQSVKVHVHVTPKYFFTQINLCTCLKRIAPFCTFLHLFNPNLDFLQAVKVTKSGHHLSQDQAIKGYGSIPGLTSQTSLLLCKSVCDIKPGIDPCLLLAWSCDRWWLDFVTFTTWKKSRLSLKGRSAFWTGVKILFLQIKL